MPALSVILLWNKRVQVLHSCGDDVEHESHGGIVDKNDPHNYQKVEVDNIKFPDQVFHLCSGIF